MKKIFVFLIVINALALTCGCDKKETGEPVSVTGNWYAEYDKNGSIPNWDGDGETPYNKAVQYYEFEENGKGYWVYFLLGNDSDLPVNQYGGLSGMEYADGAFTYTVATDGTVSIRLLNVFGDVPYNSEWTLKVSDGKITGIDDGFTYTLMPASESRTELFRQWDDAWYGGFDDSNQYTDIKDDSATDPAR